MTRAEAIEVLLYLLTPRPPVLVPCSSCGAAVGDDCEIHVGDPDWPRPYYHPPRHDLVRAQLGQAFADLVEPT